MPYYSITVVEKTEGARRRRKLPIESTCRAHAMTGIHELCKGTGFVPDYTTLGEVNRRAFNKAMTIFFGRKAQ
jgi:hypothetical protein